MQNRRGFDLSPDSPGTPAAGQNFLPPCILANQQSVKYPGQGSGVESARRSETRPMIHFRPFLRKNGPPAWPVWILFVAWLCANSPQEMTFNLVIWAGNARHFSHQERLAIDAASILSGKKAAATANVARSAPATPLIPMVPVEVVLKKIDLFLTLNVEPSPPPMRRQEFPDGSVRPPDSVRVEPPSPPPRAALAA